MELKKEKNSALVKNLLLIFAALFIGGIAFLLSRQHLAEQEAELVAKAQSAIKEKVSVIVAKTDIEVGMAATNTVLAAVEVESEHTPLDAISPTEFEQIKNHVFLRSIPRGKPILRQYVSKTIADRFSDLLESGQRALTLPVDTLNSNEEMLRPEDRVDLFLLGTASAEISAKKELIPLLQDVTVIATGKIPMVPLSNDGNPSELQSTDAQYQTITIAVFPQDAQKILLAKENGNVVTLLRNRADHNQLPASVLNYAELKNKNNQVQYFTGSAVEGGALKVQLQSVHSIAPSSDYPLQYWEKEINANKSAQK